MEWMPIKDAPRDGTKFMGWNKSHGQHECMIPENVSHYKKAEAIYGNMNTSSSRSVVWFRPTHWHQLHNPPHT